MTPVVLTDGTWFDSDQATKWERNYELEEPDENELVRQVMWRTRNGVFILENWHYSALHDCEFLHRRAQITEKRGIMWLLSNSQDIPDDLRAKVQDLEL